MKSITFSMKSHLYVALVVLEAVRVVLCSDTAAAVHIPLSGQAVGMGVRHQRSHIGEASHVDLRVAVHIMLTDLCSQTEQSVRRKLTKI